MKYMLIVIIIYLFGVVFANNCTLNWNGVELMGRCKESCHSTLSERQLALKGESDDCMGNNVVCCFIADSCVEERSGKDGYCIPNESCNDNSGSNSCKSGECCSSGHDFSNYEPNHVSEELEGGAVGESSDSSGRTRLNSQSEILFDCFRRIWDRPSNSEPIELAFIPYYLYDDMQGYRWDDPLFWSAGFGWADYDGTVLTVPDGADDQFQVGQSLGNWPKFGYRHSIIESVGFHFGRAVHRWAGRQYSFKTVSHPRILMVPLSRWPSFSGTDNPVQSYFASHTDWSSRLNFCPEDGSAPGSLAFYTPVNSPSSLRDKWGQTHQKCHAYYGFANCPYSWLAQWIPETKQTQLLPTGVRSFVHELGHGYLGLAHDRCLDPLTTVHYEYGHPMSMMGTGHARSSQWVEDDSQLQFGPLAAASQAYFFGFLSPEFVKVVDGPGVFKLEPFDTRVDYAGHDGKYVPQHQHASFLLQIAPQMSTGEQPPYVLLISFSRHTGGVASFSRAVYQLERGGIYITYHERKTHGYQRSGTVVDATFRSNPSAHFPNGASSRAAQECEDAALSINHQLRIDSLDLVIELLAVEWLNGESGPPVAFVGIERMSSLSAGDAGSLCGDGLVDLLSGLNPSERIKRLKEKDVRRYYQIGEECDGGVGCLDNCQCAPGFQPNPGYYQGAAVLSPTVGFFQRNSQCYPTCGDGLVSGTEECENGDNCNKDTCKCLGPEFWTDHFGRCRPRSDFVDAGCHRNQTIEVLRYGQQCANPLQYVCNDGQLDLGDFCDASFPPHDPDGDRCASDCLSCAAGARPRLTTTTSGLRGSVRWQWPEHGKPGLRLSAKTTNRFASPKVFGFSYGALGGIEIRGCAPWEGDSYTEQLRRAVRWSSDHHLSNRTDIGYWRMNQLPAAATNDDGVPLVNKPLFWAIAIGGIGTVFIIVAAIILCLMLAARRRRRQRHHQSTMLGVRRYSERRAMTSPSASSRPPRRSSHSYRQNTRRSSSTKPDLY